MLFKNICIKLIGISLLFVAVNSTFAAQPFRVAVDNTFVPQPKKRIAADRGFAVEPRPVTGTFVLHNNSSFDIYCRCRSNAEAEANLYVTCVDRLIKTGDSATLPMTRSYSIKTAGTSSLAAYSYFYDVPKPNVLANNSLTQEQLRQYDRDLRADANALPIIHVTSGITHGWSFTVGVIKQQD